MSCQRLSFCYFRIIKHHRIKYLNRSLNLHGIFRNYTSLPKQSYKDIIWQSTGIRKNITFTKLPSTVNTTAIFELLFKNKYAVWIATGTFALILVKLIGIIGVLFIATPLLYFKNKSIQVVRQTLERDARYVK